jgi:hypothetical protein
MLHTAGDTIATPLRPPARGSARTPAPTCEDHVDGILSHAVEVSGNIVNVRITGGKCVIHCDC